MNDIALQTKKHTGKAGIRITRLHSTKRSIATKYWSNSGWTQKKSHIVNGHVPVKVKKSESPIKANGKLFVIDGGMSIPYQKVTGVSGYTMIYNSFGLVLVEHKEFESMSKAIKEEKDIISNRVFIETNATRKDVGDTDVGTGLRVQINDLKMLLAAFRKGLIKEKR